MSLSTSIISPVSIPPLENGDRLTRPEFERRYQAMTQLKKVRVYKKKEEGQPISSIKRWSKLISPRMTCDYSRFVTTHFTQWWIMFLLRGFLPETGFLCVRPWNPHSSGVSDIGNAWQSRWDVTATVIACHIPTRHQHICWCRNPGQPSLQQIYVPKIEIRLISLHTLGQQKARVLNKLYIHYWMENIMNSVMSETQHPTELNKHLHVLWVLMASW